MTNVVVAVFNVQGLCCLEEEAMHFFPQTTREYNLLAGAEGDMWEATCPILLAPH